MSLRVCVIDDDQTITDELSFILTTSPHIKQAHFAHNKAEAVQKIQSHAVDVFLLDLGLPDIDGQDLIPLITEYQPEAKIIILTTFASSRHVLECFRRGAHGYILKYEANKGIVEKLLQAANGNMPVSSEISKILIKKLNESTQPYGIRNTTKLKEFEISEKESQVLQLLAQGHSIDAISTRICKTTHTVNMYLRSIYRKLNVHSRAAAVHVAITEGLIEK